jgi:hypothetical protein
MNKIILIFLLFTFFNSYSQEKRVIQTKVDKVTLFIKNAQITRNKSLNIEPGISILKFNNLSPFILTKSVQIKADGDVTVLSVNHQQNYLDGLEKPKGLIELERLLKTIQSKTLLERTHLSIISEEVLFLNKNRKIGGTETVSVTNLKDAYLFYGEKLTALKLKEIERKETLEELLKEEFNLKNQIKTLSSKKEYASGEVLVKIESRNKTPINLVLSYLVKNASWYPSYDIRAKNIGEPIQLIYKANVKQDTKVDWKEAKLKFSSANPSLSGVAPELKTYYVDYNTAPPRYNRDIDEVSGRVFDENNSPLPGANVLVRGTTIATTTDFDGNYSIILPKNNNRLAFSFIGYETKTISASRENQNIYLTPNYNELKEVVVLGYATQKTSYDAESVVKMLEGKAAGVQIRGASSNAIPVARIENQTSVSFEISMPYTILSNNKSYAVDMAHYNIDADYQYYSIPKVEKYAFLVAKIRDWQQYNLLEAEANIFFENTFVGKTILDVRSVIGTLNVSLGRDKNISVNREKVTNFTSKKFVGSKKEVSRAWKISIKNNKSQKINLQILDQIPVSTLDEIKVELLEASEAKLNTDTGKVKWETILDANEQVNYYLKYVVKHPKNRNLVIE